jgi:hypothetical protein
LVEQVKNAVFVILGHGETGVSIQPGAKSSGKL